MAMGARGDRDIYLVSLQPINTLGNIQGRWDAHMPLFHYFLVLGAAEVLFHSQLPGPELDVNPESFVYRRWGLGPVFLTQLQKPIQVLYSALHTLAFFFPSEFWPLSFAASGTVGGIRGLVG